MHHLTARLHAPFASWGDVGLGNHRPTSEAPTRSALLGLLGAALGIERNDRVGQERLGTSIGLATQVRKAGHPLNDYHTVQTRPESDRRPFSTRKGELDLPREDRITMLTQREYRTDVSYVLAAWPRVGASIGLDVIAAAMRAPRFTPYLGRRSCPLSAPFGASVSDHVTLRAAFDSLPWMKNLDGPHSNSGRVVWSDPHEAPGYERKEESWRWDEPASGSVRGFQRRKVHQYRAEADIQ